MTSELFEAIERHDSAHLAALLRAGADANTARPRAAFWVPLRAAVEELAEGGPPESVALLLRHGARVDGTGRPGDATPLIVAALNRQLEGARILLAAGADPNARDDEGDTPLGLSLKHGDTRLEALLRLCGAVDSATPGGGPTARKVS